MQRLQYHGRDDERYVTYPVVEDPPDRNVPKVFIAGD